MRVNLPSKNKRRNFHWHWIQHILVNRNQDPRKSSVFVTYMKEPISIEKTTHHRKSLRLISSLHHLYTSPRDRRHRDPHVSRVLLTNRTKAQDKGRQPSKNLNQDVKLEERSSTVNTHSRPCGNLWGHFSPSWTGLSPRSLSSPLYTTLERTPPPPATLRSDPHVIEKRDPSVLPPN